MGKYDYAPLTALVTGASSGIGEALARALARRKIGTLVLTARSTDRLEHVAEDLRAAHETNVTVIPLDLSQTDAAKRLKEETDRREQQIDMLINNAGFGSAGPFESLPADREAEIVTVNVSAVVALTCAYLPGILSRGRGGVMNVGSTAGYQPAPYMATYGASKAFISSFTEALWAEARDQGRKDVRLFCLCPGSTATEFGKNIRGDRGRFEDFPTSTADEVAKVGLDGWERNAPSVIVGKANAARAFSIRFAPRTTVARMGAALLRPRSA